MVVVASGIYKGLVENILLCKNMDYEGLIAEYVFKANPVLTSIQFKQEVDIYSQEFF